MHQNQCTNTGPRQMRPPPLVLGQESNNSRMQENTVAVRILGIGQHISPPPFLRSGYGSEIVALVIALGPDSNHRQMTTGIYLKYMLEQ